MCRADAVLRVALVIGALAGLALVATGLVFVLSPDTIIERFVGQPAAGDCSMLGVYFPLHKAKTIKT